MNPQRLPWWQPTYRSPRGAAHFTIRGLSTAECPVSLTLLDPQLNTWVEWFKSFKLLSSVGVPCFGELERWPIWAVEVVKILEIEYRREMEARSFLGAQEQDDDAGNSD